MTSDNLKKYVHKTITDFSNEINKYHIPDNFRIYEYQDLYKIAKEQIREYFNDELTYEQFIHPDNILRNVIKLWPIDKKSSKIKRKE